MKRMGDLCIEWPGAHTERALDLDEAGHGGQGLGVHGAEGVTQNGERVTSQLQRSLLADASAWAVEASGGV